MHVYIAGIGGSGLGPLAELSQDCGFGVHGSTLEESPQTTQLTQRQIQYSLDQSGVYLNTVHKTKPIDLYVHSSAVTEDNPEYQKSQQLGIPVTKRSGLINTILEQKKLKLLAVAGTHGKTTTTAMCVWLFKQLGIPVSYSIGTTLSWGPSAQYEEDSEWFVYECDEFDRNFLDFRPDISVITTLDYDHPDTYPTQEEYFKAFEQFIRQTDGRVISYKKDRKKLSLPIGEKPVTDKWGKKHNKKEDVLDGGELNGLMYQTPKKMLGQHNRENMEIAMKAVQYAVRRPIEEGGLPLVYELDTNNPEKILAFPGSDRRFEKISDGLYSDYAHHPTEIAATIQMAKELGKNVVIVYQPHQNLRQYEVKEAYRECFKGVKRVYWLPTYLSREPEGLAVLSPQELAQVITNTEVVLSEFDDALMGDLRAELAEGNTVVAMGAGSIDAWVRGSFASNKK